MSDLISANTKVLVNGDVVGNVNYVSGYAQFSGDAKEQTGHFFPLKFNEKYKGESLTSKGLVYGEKTYTVDEDLTLITRIENVKDGKVEIVKGEEPVVTLNFGTATLLPAVGADAVTIPADKDFGKFGKNSEFLQDVSITWDGINGTVKGTVKKYTFSDESIFPGDAKTGHFIGVVITNHDGEAITLVTGKTKTDKSTDWVIRIDEIMAAAKKITFKAGNATLGVLDLSGVTLGDGGDA